MFSSILIYYLFMFVLFIYFSILCYYNYVYNYVSNSYSMCQKKGNIPQSNYAITTHRLWLHDLRKSRVIASYRTIITLRSVYKMGTVWWPLGVYESENGTQ